MCRIHCSIGALCAVLIMGCSSGNSDSIHSFNTFLEEGVPVAETTGGPKYSEPLFTYEKILTLEQNEEQQETLLYRPYIFMMDEEGRYYVADMGNNRVAVFDQAGKFSHSIGREGQGPGEFRSVLLQSVGNGYVSVLDTRQQRLSILTYDGAFVRHISFSGERVDVESRIYEGPDATQILLRRFIHSEHRPRIVSSWRALVFSADGEKLCQFETEPVHTMTISQTVEASTGGYYQGQPSAAYHPGKGVVMSTGTEPVLTWFDLNGEIIQSIRLNIPPEPVTPEERSIIMARLDQEIEDADHPMLEAIRIEQKKIAEIPKTKGYWCSLVVDDAGFIWAQKPYPYYLDEYPEGSTFLIFSPEGEYLGITVVPTVWGTVSRGHFLSIDSDKETGLSIPNVYKIHPAVRGLIYN